jgi:hypothetical protein
MNRNRFAIIFVLLLQLLEYLVVVLDFVDEYAFCAAAMVKSDSN